MPEAIPAQSSEGLRWAAALTTVLLRFFCRIVTVNNKTCLLNLSVGVLLFCGGVR